MKTEPLGVCDLCKGPIPEGEWFTKRGPRRYCCRDCRNTANSRNGKPVRVAKLRAAVAAGTWRNPAAIRAPTSEEQAARASKGRRREVAAGTWRNPALTADAREKLSRPRVHADDPALHRALEKLRRGLAVAELTPEEAEAHRAYRRRQRAAWWARIPAERRDAWRARWRLAKRSAAQPAQGEEEQ